MARTIPIKRSLGDIWHVIAAGVALVAISLWLLFGTTGLFAWNDYSRELASRRVELAQLQAQEIALQNRQRLLDPRHVDPDLVDEKIREDLNLLHPDDIVVPLR